MLLNWRVVQTTRRLLRVNVALAPSPAGGRLSFTMSANKTYETMHVFYNIVCQYMASAIEHLAEILQVSMS